MSGVTFLVNKEQHLFDAYMKNLAGDYTEEDLFAEIRWALEAAIAMTKAQLGFFNQKQTEVIKCLRAGGELTKLSTGSFTLTFQINRNRLAMQRIHEDDCQPLIDAALIDTQTMKLTEAGKTVTIKQLIEEQTE